MKIVGIAIVRTGPELNDPIPLSVANDLSSFGFFQRQVRAVRQRERISRLESIGISHAALDWIQTLFCMLLSLMNVFLNLDVSSFDHDSL